MLTIGFTNHYYTLWSVTQSIRHGQGGAQYAVTTFHYHQNLSMDFDAAKAKIEKLTDEYEIDLELRGENGTHYVTERQIKAMDTWCFTFGRLAGCDMRTASDVWQLTRAMNEEPVARRRVYARRRLIELKELVVYPWVEYKKEYQDLSLWDGSEESLQYCAPVVKQIKRKYCTSRKMAILEDQKNNGGHHFEAGKRVTVAVTLVKGFEFPSVFGYNQSTYVYIMRTEDGKLVKYKGSKYIVWKGYEGEQITHSITATVEHTEYRGVKETMLKRPKIVA